jgi:hypothetical protein
MLKLSERIEALESRLRELKYRQQRVESRMRVLQGQRERRDDTRRKILVGALVLTQVEKGERTLTNAPSAMRHARQAATQNGAGADAVSRAAAAEQPGHVGDPEFVAVAPTLENRTGFSEISTAGHGETSSAPPGSRPSRSQEKPATSRTLPYFLGRRLLSL